MSAWEVLTVARDCLVARDCAATLVLEAMRAKMSSRLVNLAGFM
jgi:hypothetical protein